MAPEDQMSHFSDVEASGIRREGFRPLEAGPRLPVSILLLFLLFEYLRLHNILPILDTLKVQTAVLGALLLIVIAETAKRGVRLTRQSWLLLGFLGLAAFTIIPAANNFYAYRFAYSLTLTLIGFFAITHILQNERDLKRFLSLLVGIHMYIAVRVALGYNPTRLDPTGYLAEFTGGSYFLGDENDLALAMILILPLALYLFRQARSLPGQLFWGAGSVAILLSTIFTHSRGGFVGLAVMSIYWIATNRNKWKALGSLVLAAALVVAVAPQGYWERMETITETQSGTANVRRNNWAAARRMFYDSPIWGVGGNNFGVLLPDYAIEYPEERRPNRWGRATHSMYFQVLAEFGLVGVLLICSVLLWNFRDLRQVISLSRAGRCPPSIGQLAESLLVSWVGFLVPAAFISVLGYPHLYYLTALTVVVRELASLESSPMVSEPVGALEGAG